jgi:hypothetical protein
MDYTDRVDGYQIRDVVYLGRPPADAPLKFSIDKWVPEEPHMGIVYDIVDGRFVPEEKMITEHCYSVGCLEWDDREPQFVFRSYGLRWLEEAPSRAVINMILAFCKQKEREILKEEGRWHGDE